MSFEYSKKWAVITILIIVFFVLRSVFNQTESQTTTIQQSPQAENEEDEIVRSFELIKSKDESAGGNNNKMELYVATAEFDVSALEALCRQRKSQFKTGTFYYLVVFDSADNAVFPQDPFTAEYGLEEDVQKHIKAMYTYNRLNGFSELDIYDGNQWESIPNTIEL